jgi:hypothetical protein
VLRLCDAVGARSIREFDDRFAMTQSLFNWCQDLEMALQNGGSMTRSCARRGCGAPAQS